MYKIDYSTQLQKRIDEFPFSGMCCKCIIWFFEKRKDHILGYYDESGMFHMGDAIGSPGDVTLSFHENSDH